VVYILAALMLLSYIGGIDLIPANINISTLSDNNSFYDVYSSPSKADKDKKVITIIHGFVETGNRDPDLVKFARLLARHGYIVIVPDIAGLKSFRIGYDETQEVKNALNRMGALYPDNRKGFISYCYANGLAVAALHEDKALREKIDFMILWGGYSDLKELTMYNLTGNYRLSNGKLLYAQPNESVRARYLDQECWVDYLPHARQKILRNAINTKNARGLNKVEMSVYRFLLNYDWHKFDEYYAALPVQVRDWMNYFSPQNYMDVVNCKVIFIHSYYDTLIPSDATKTLFSMCRSKDRTLIIPSVFQHFDLRFSKYVNYTFAEAMSGTFQYYRFCLALMKI